MVGGDAIISRVAAGEIDFDKCIATTGLMAKLRTVARILGPRGLMPSPKLGTLVDGAAITKAIGDMKGGRVEYRSASCFWEGFKSNPSNDALPLYKLICDLAPY